MGRWLTKKEYAKRARKIVKLRDVDKLLFTEIAERISVKQGVVEYSYHKFKEKEN